MKHKTQVTQKMIVLTFNIVTRENEDQGISLEFYSGRFHNKAIHLFSTRECQPSRCLLKIL